MPKVVLGDDPLGQPGDNRILIVRILQRDRRAGQRQRSLGRIDIHLAQQTHCLERVKESQVSFHIE